MFIHYSFLLVTFVPSIIYTLGSVYKKNIFEKLAFLLLLIISALAYNVGGDYSNYYIVYNKIASGHFLYMNEPLFYLLNKIVLSLGLPFNTIYFLAHSFFFIVLYNLFQEINVNYRFIIFTLFMFSFDGYFSNLIYLRQEIAMTFIILSVKYIQSRSLLKFSAMIFLGALFHNIAIIFFPIYYLYSISRKKLYLVFLAIFIGVYFVSYTIEILGLTKYTYYLVRDYEASITIGYYLKIFILIIGLYLFDEIKSIYFTLFLVGQFIALCEILLPLLFRIEVFFAIFHIYALTLIIMRFDKYYNKYLIYMAISIMFLYNISSLNRTILKKNDYYFWDKYRLILFEENDLKGVTDENRYRKYK